MSIRRRRIMVDDMKDEFTLVLLHFDGNYTNHVDGGVSFSRGGSISYGDGVFGQAIYFTGADYLYRNRAWFLDFLNLNEYTIEYWGKATMANGWVFGVGIDDGTLSAFVFRAREASSSLKLNMEFGVTGTASRKIEALNISGNVREFNHYAVTKKEGVHRLFFNGNLVATKSGLSFTTPNANFFIGGRSSNSDLSAATFIDELRMSSICRYTENFTIQTKPFK